MIEPKVSFLEASKKIKSSTSNQDSLKKCNLFLKTSASMHQLTVYLNYYSILSSVRLEIQTLPFGTLSQTLIQHSQVSDDEDILFLFPWDFLPSFDWRTGVPMNNLDYNQAKNEVNKFKDIVLKSCSKNIYYLPSPELPLMETSMISKKVMSLIELSALEVGASFLDKNFLCMKTYLSNGCPFSSNSLSHIAEEVIADLVKQTNAKKIIVTDLDNTFWSGVLGEDRAI